MKPIRQILSRILWDKEYGKGNFELAYSDRNKPEYERVNLRNIEIENGNSFSFVVLGSDRLYHDIPYHRVREVYKNGELVWKRVDPCIKRK